MHHELERGSLIVLLGSGVEHAPYYTHSPDTTSDATERKPPEATAERQKHKEKEGLPQRTQRLGLGVCRCVQVCAVLMGL